MRLFHHVLIYIVNLHLVLPALNLSTLDAGILIMMQQIRFIMFSLTEHGGLLHVLPLAVHLWRTSRGDFWVSFIFWVLSWDCLNSVLQCQCLSPSLALLITTSACLSIPGTPHPMMGGAFSLVWRETSLLLLVYSGSAYIKYLIFNKVIHFDEVFIYDSQVWIKSLNGIHILLFPMTIPE